MIRSEHVKQDMDVLANKIKDGTVKIGDVGTVVLTLGKLLLSIRANQILQLKHDNIEMQKPKTRAEGGKPEATGDAEL